MYLLLGISCWQYAAIIRLLVHYLQVGTALAQEIKRYGVPLTFRLGLIYTLFFFLGIFCL